MMSDERKAEQQMSDQQADLAALVKAAQGARFVLHCRLMGARKRIERCAEGGDEMGEANEQMGRELDAETALGLARALVPFAPDVPACHGCQHDDVWAKSPRDLIADYEASCRQHADGMLTDPSPS